MNEEQHPDNEVEVAAEQVSAEAGESETETNLSERIEALMAEIATLKAALADRRPPPSIDAGAGRNTAVPLTKEALARMTPAEIGQLDWADVRLVLAAG